MKRLLGVVFAIFTAVIGYHIHGGFFWTAMDFIFSPLAWLKWLICHEVNMSVIKATFGFFFQ